MTKSQHISLSRQWLRKVVKCRREIIVRKNKGRPDTPEMEKAIRHISYHAENIRDFNTMLQFLQNPKNIDLLKLIIPTNKGAYWEEHESFVFEGNLILGRATKQMEITFNS